MSNALLSDIEARAERRRTRTRDDMWQELTRHAWSRANAATDPAERRRWLERAHRLLPKDGMIAVTLASTRLADRDFESAASLFRSVADRHDIADAWLGAAACAHLLGDPAAARIALAAALRRRAPDDTMRTLAAAVAPDAWCGLTVDGLLQSGPTRPTSVLLDGTPIPLRWTRAGAALPPAWRTADRLDVETAQGPALGSPLPLRAFAGLEGFVETPSSGTAAAGSGGIEGWAWHRADPARDPEIRISGPLGARTIRPTTPAENTDAGPLARPRRFVLTAAECAALGTPLALRGPDGRHLLGSPLDPTLVLAPTWADTIGPPPPPARPVPVDVVIPIHRGLAETLACIDSVLPTLPRGARLIAVDDASPDPALRAALDALARRRRITLIRLPENRGFPGAANAGIAAAPARDVVLLNSDTLVPPGWLDRLRAAAYAAPGIGTVTPFTNDGTILSYPDPAGGNPAPDLPATIATDALAQKANGPAPIDIPVGVGFCLYIRRACLDMTGPLREDLFAQGYGEENDLCLRARHHGWRNVAAPNVFVAHVGATSFGPARQHLVRRNAAILARLHPGYDALVAAHVAADPLHPARRRMDALRWATTRAHTGSVLLLTHAGGGGVDRVVQDRATAIAATGQRPILLKPWRSPANEPGLRISTPSHATPSQATPNLAYRLPAELDALLRLLRATRPTRIELHHTLGHDPAIAGLVAGLRIPLTSIVHDYARFCPRIALVGTERRYCGEPDIPGCEACIADLGSLLEDDPPVRTLLARSATELARATSIVAPSADAAARIRRHFPGIAPEVEPWEDDSRLPPLTPAPPASTLRIVVPGAIGVEKGFEVLLACARDARARNLPISFTVVGFTADDERLMAAGPVHVTGEYAETEATALIREQRAHLALIPSVWPETWCFALSRAWEAGLPTAVFDLGAQAERVRSTGRGWIFPLGLQPRALNDALLRLAPK